MTEPVVAVPQPDRQLLVDLFNDAERLRGDLTRAMNWLHVYWPAGFRAPGWATVVDEHSAALVCWAYQAEQAPELATLRRVMAHRTEDAEYVTAISGEWPRVWRRFGQVAIEVWAYRTVWDEADRIEDAVHAAADTFDRLDTGLHHGDFADAVTEAVAPMLAGGVA